MSNITIDEFVSREVIYCVSSLVSTLITAAGETGKVGDISQDELYSLCQRDDWETPVAYHIQTEMDSDELTEELTNRYVDADTLEGLSTLMLAQKLEGLVRDNDDWQDFAEDNRIDPETVEAYEHWIVSSFLASRLEAKGEIVARDIAGLTIWGRCTTGQRISMDGVIESIYNEMLNA